MAKVWLFFTAREVPGLDGHLGGIFSPSVHLKKEERQQEKEEEKLQAR